MSPAELQLRAELEQSTSGALYTPPRHNVARPDWLRELDRLGEIGVACRYRSALSTLLRATQPTIVQQGKERLPSNLNCTPQLVGRGDTRCKAQWH